LTLAALGWLAAFTAAFVDGGPWSLHVRLTVAGAVLEATGITLLALDLVDAPARRAAALVGHAARRAIRRIQRMLFSARAVRGAVSMGVATEINSAGAVTVSRTQALSLEEQIVALRHELEEVRNQVAAVEGKLSREVADLQRSLRLTRDELEASITLSIAESKREHYEWRLGGFAIALVGSFMLSWANLV
jgi:hypothetical protein